MKQHIHFELKSEANNSFFCQKAANSADLDLNKKLSHVMDLDIDFPDDWNVGLIVGASGSGKTTLANHLYGANCFDTYIDLLQPIINQFDDSLSYDERVNQLISVGLSQVPCWVRPAGTLSNGQRFRAEIALQMSKQKEITIIDEWTSVVDRTIGKIMSHSVQKHARRFNKKIVLCSCHYDVMEWLQPDWVIDCNEQYFRRLLRQERTEKLQLDIREIDSKSWKYFSKYHYLSENLPGGKVFYFGLFHAEKQIGFQCYANYIPCRKGDTMIFHSNRLVIHPDYCGLSLGKVLVNNTAMIMKKKGFKIMTKFCSLAMFRTTSNDRNWRLRNEGILGSNSGEGFGGGNMERNNSKKDTTRQKQKWWSFEYIGE